MNNTTKLNQRTNQIDLRTILLNQRTNFYIMDKKLIIKNNYECTMKIKKVLSL
jgi:hypothetical protein